jgi:hypothetical protein
MYEKVLEERKIMFFRHCPPIANLDDVSFDRPQAPFRSAAGYQCSVFYYWWAFLRENAAYRACCDELGQGPLQDLYSFFGDVRGDDFVEWWSFGANGRGGDSYAGRDLFCESVLDPITIGPVREGDASHVQLSVPVIPDLKRLTAEFQRVMRLVVEERAQPDPSQDDGPLFAVAGRNPSLNSLHKMLSAFRARAANPGLSNYDLAEELGITENVKGTRGSYQHDNVVYTTIGRLLKKADVLVQNVQYGRFPDHTDYAAIGKVPELPRGLAELASRRQAS